MAETRRERNLVPPGTAAYSEASLEAVQDGKAVGRVQLSEPVVIAVAAKPEGWGFFQFPRIWRDGDGTMRVSWNMQPDSIKSYGSHNSGDAVSSDGGKSWRILSETTDRTRGLLLPGGDRISIVTPKALKAEELDLPRPVAETGQEHPKGTRVFYRLHEMPANRQGVFLKRLRRGQGDWVEEHATLDDPKALRYSLGGLVPLLWWGDLRIAADGSIIAGIYPGYSLNDDGSVDPKCGVNFYRSTDEGRSWRFQGRIPYQPDLGADPKGEKRMGYTEPAFEILADGTYVCVLRSSDNEGVGPMYLSVSNDHGVTWSRPKVFTRTGVLPQLLQLENGVVVLSSGRPGVQVRFSFDGSGATWTDPFEMLPYYGSTEEASCGYTNLLATGPDRGLMVYADFQYVSETKEIRKAIKVREIIVTPLSPN